MVLRQIEPTLFRANKFPALRDAGGLVGGKVGSEQFDIASQHSLLVGIHSVWSLHAMLLRLFFLDRRRAGVCYPVGPLRIDLCASIRWQRIAADGNG
jgi:hypothetical protein